MFNLLSPRDLVFRTDNMDETVPHTIIAKSRLKTIYTWDLRLGMLQPTAALNNNVFWEPLNNC